MENTKNNLKVGDKVTLKSYYNQGVTPRMGVLKETLPNYLGDGRMVYQVKWIVSGLINKYFSEDVTLLEEKFIEQDGAYDD